MSVRFCHLTMRRPGSVQAGADARIREVVAQLQRAQDLLPHGVKSLAALRPESVVDQDVDGCAACKAGAQDRLPVLAGIDVRTGFPLPLERGLRRG